jgi:hypothetical protein
MWVWNPRHGEPSACDMPLIRPFQASVDTVKNTTEELPGIAA